MRVRFGAVLIVIAAMVGYRTGGFIRNPFADGDLFWQRRLGEFVLANHAIPHALGTDVFSSPGAPWLPQEWLFSTVVALAFDRNALWIIAVISGLLAFAALAICAWRAVVAGSSTWAVVFAVVFAGVAISPNFALRAEVWVWPLFALALWVLENDDRPALWWLVPIAILWANLHASVMILVPIVWLKTAIQFALRRPARTHLLLCVAVPVATLCTPFGIGLPLYALELLNSPLRPYIAQWRPTNFSTMYTRFGYLPLVAALVLAFARRFWATRPFDVAVAAVLGVMSLFATRNVALFGFAAIVPASLALRTLSTSRDRLPAFMNSGVVTSAMAAVALLFFTWFGVQVGSPGIAWPAPFGSVQRLAALPGDHRLFCFEYSWCSVAIGEGTTRIFLDGRADPYPPKVWADFGLITHEQPGWQQLLASYDVNSVITWRGGGFEQYMGTLPHWREIEDTNDACCVLFVR